MRKEDKDILDIKVKIMDVLTRTNFVDGRYTQTPEKLAYTTNNVYSLISTNNPERKFHVGDLIVRKKNNFNNTIIKIIDIKDKYIISGDFEEGIEFTEEDNWRVLTEEEKRLYFINCNLPG